jgi:competence protein ComGC
MLEQEREERLKHLRSIAMWIVIVLIGLLLGIVVPRLLS